VKIGRSIDRLIGKSHQTTYQLINQFVCIGFPLMLSCPYPLHRPTEGENNVQIHFRWFIGLLIVLLLAGCTRRPDAPAAAPTPAAAEDVDAQAPAEPDVVAETPTPEAAEPEAEATEESITGVDEGRRSETFQYTVEEGDSLSWIAEKFETSTQVLRELNFLPDDSIRIGSILEVPLVEGVSPESITADGIPAPPPGPFEYEVQKGDTLGSIALQFDVSTVSIIEANSLENPDALIVGSSLLIPDYVVETEEPAASSGATVGIPSPDAGVSYIVQPGDSLLSIARSFGVTPDNIAIANNITNRNVLRVGQKLIIPGITELDAAIARGSTHTVQSGETLSEIAAQFGTTVDAIKSANNLTSDTISVGQELIIPGQ